jgi:hypothetical protein
MSRLIWGCYSVADHLEPRAFVADLLLYDRLVIPTPSDDDVARWEERWDPERQARLLGILGGFAERVEWTEALREQFQSEWSPANAALYIDDASAYGATLGPAQGACEDPYMVSRRIITEQLGGKVAEERGDVRAVAVYAKPDRFDREWRLTGTLPFLRRKTRAEPGALREVATPAVLERQRLAKLVVTRLVVPDEGHSDEEVLRRTVDLVSRNDVWERRAAFHQLIASLDAERLRDETVIGEVEDLLNAFNESVRRHTRKQQARLAVQVLTTMEGVAGLWAPPVTAAAGPTTAIGEAAIERHWPSDTPQAQQAQLGAVALLAEAQRAL